MFSQKLEELLSPDTTAPALDGLKRSDTPGQLVSYVISFKYYSADYYVGLYAFDEAGNKGNMSNVVLVNVPAPPAAENSTASTQPIVLETSTDWTMVGAILGAVGVLLLVLVIGLYCHCARSRAKFSKTIFAGQLRSSGVKVQIPSPPESENTDSSSYESDMKAGTLVQGIAHPKVRRGRGREGRKGGGV